MLTLTDEQAKQLRDALWAAADAIDTSDCEDDEDEPAACDECGGSQSNIVGCVACCRDCGYPCELETGGEGFHVREED